MDFVIKASPTGFWGLDLGAGLASCRCQRTSQVLQLCPARSGRLTLDYFVGLLLAELRFSFQIDTVSIIDVSQPLKLCQIRQPELETIEFQIPCNMV